MRNPDAADSFQFGEIQFDGTTSIPAADFAIMTVQVTGNPVTTVTLSWGSEAGASYSVQGNPNLGPVGSWIDVGTVVAAGTTTSTTVTLANHQTLIAQPQVFFRVRRN